MSKNTNHSSAKHETIHLRQPVGVSLASLGGEMMVETVDGKKPLKIPAGTQSGATLVLKESGVPRFNSPRCSTW